MVMDGILIQKQLSIIQMNNTPSKRQNVNSKEIKASGNRIPQNELAEVSSSLPPQNWMNFVKGKIKKHYIITTIVIGFLILACVLTPVIIFVYKTNSQYIIYNGPIMYSYLKNGAKFSSEVLNIKKGSSQLNVPLSINKVDSNIPAIRYLQQEPNSISIYQMNYYHKNSQISVAYDSKLNFQARIPADTGIGYVVAKAPPSSYAQLQKISEVLPNILISEIEKTQGKKAKITTELSYDGVYNNQTKEYTILTQNNAYHPDQFAIIQAGEINLNDKKPAVSNFSNVTEVSKAIAETISNIAGNLKNIILENKEKLEKFVGPITAIIVKSISQQNNVLVKISQQSNMPEKINDQIAKCTRVGNEVIRCPEKVWKSGELKISNPNPVEPLEVWEIVVEAKA